MAEARAGGAGRTETAVAIAGSGFSGLGVAIALGKAGVDDFVVLERAGALGGTWRDNVYPGCACDVPSHLYSFSFAPRSDWTRAYAPQAEIRAYLEWCADRFDVRRRIRFGQEIVEAAWSEPDARWLLRTRGGGALAARVLVLATGGLSNPAVPAIPGLGRFRGARFHSARWDPAVDLRDRRVAVIGTGASAIQIVPSIQPLVSSLYVLQRTPPWILPRRDRAFRPWEQAVLRVIPGARWAYRQALYWRLEGRVLAFVDQPGLMRLVARRARRHLARSIPDPALRARLTPSYLPGCKRILLSDDYYPAVARPNVEVVTDAIAEVTERGVALCGGRALDLDAIVFGTGFEVHRHLGGMAVIGRGGVSLAERWRHGAEAYLGLAVAGFPNLFLMAGPNTALGHSSMIVVIEGQARYAARAIRHLLDERLASLEVKRDVESAYNAWLQGRAAGAVWSSGCRSWYLDPHGRNTTLWPGSATAFRARTARLRLADYERRPVGGDP